MVYACVPLSGKEHGIVNRKHKIWEHASLPVTGKSVSYMVTFKKMCREMVHDLIRSLISDEKSLALVS